MGQVEVYLKCERQKPKIRGHSGEKFAERTEKKIKKKLK